MERITQLYRIGDLRGENWRKLVEAICNHMDHVSLFHLLTIIGQNGVFMPFHPALEVEECYVEAIDKGFQVTIRGFINGVKYVYCIDAYYDEETITVIPCPISAEQE